MNNKKILFWKNCIFQGKSNHSVSNCSLKQRDDKEGKSNFWSRSKTHIKLFNNLIWAYQNQLHPNEQLSSYPVNFSHVTITIHENVQCKETDILHLDPSILNHLQLHDHWLNLVPATVIVKENSTLTELHHVQGTLHFLSSDKILCRFIVLPAEISVTVLFFKSNSEKRRYFGNDNSPYPPPSGLRLGSTFNNNCQYFTFKPLW